MLQFFRKYQTYFFAVITVVIIISFSFFGTYNTLPANSIHEQVAFTATDGTEVKRMELDELVLFIGTDNEDKRLFGGMWGPNFLNDGVIKNDFLETGLAQILMNAYPNQVERDLQARLEKEKRYTLYRHPYAKFLTAEAAWAYFAPNMKSNYDTLRNAEKATNSDAINARIALYLEEKKFSAPLLKQVLRYQQKQYNWLTPDPTLDRLDLSLFGYHTLDDWFGPRTLRIIAEFIINASKIAEQKGYKVSKAEALSELMRNAQSSYQQNIQNPHLGVTNPTEYFNEQLRRLGMDQTKAVHVWQQVLLFRRLFQDVGNAALVDPLLLNHFNAYAKETVSGDLYRLPPEMRFADYRTLQKFEAYLNAVSKSSGNEKDLLALPTNFLSVAEVKKKHPELTQKRYLVQLSQIKKQNLDNRVGIKEMWNWEVEDHNWALLKNQFPDLGIKDGQTREQRFSALDNLDDNTRSRVDAYARKAIVDAHPEWIKQALDQIDPKQVVLGLSPSGRRSIFGTDNNQELIQLLDEAPLAVSSPSDGSENAHKLAQYTTDNDTYYRIAVDKRAPDEEVLTFAEANREGVLDALLDHQLEVHYVKIREGKPELFQKDDKTWKDLADVKDLVADSYYQKMLKAIRDDYAAETHGNGQQPTTGDLSAAARFYSYFRGVQQKLQQGSMEASGLVREEVAKKTPEEEFDHRTTVADQWKLEKAAYKADRSVDSKDLDKQELFALSENAWSKIQVPVNGDLTVFQLKSKEMPGDTTAEFDKQDIAYMILADDAQRNYLHHVLLDIKEKHAISLDYLDNSVETIEAETPLQE